MAQIVILAPKGEDVSAGETALKEAGFDVEVLEATPSNLLHMAIGMLDGTDDEDDEGPLAAAAEDDAATDEESDDDMADDEESDDVKEDLGTVTIVGEPVKAYLGTGPMSLLRAVNFQASKAITSFNVNESKLTFFNGDDGKSVMRLSVETAAAKSEMVNLKIVRSTTEAKLILNLDDAKRLGLK